MAFPKAPSPDVLVERILHDVQPDRPTPAGDLHTTGPLIPGLPGRLTLLDPAPVRDYHALSRFHYRGRHPATFARIVSMRFTAHDAAPRDPPIIAAVAVLSHPVPVSRGRDRAFGLSGWTYGRRLRFANDNIRTISRVIVHPSFRSLGLSTMLIRRLIETCPTPFIEALARMGRAHPLFDCAGMTRVEPLCEDEPVYFYAPRQLPSPPGRGPG